MYFRDKLSIKEICRQTSLSRNTVLAWLREREMVEPKYPARRIVTKLDDYANTLKTGLKADSGRNKRERRTKGQMWLALYALGYTGNYGRVCAFARGWKTSEGLAASKVATTRLSPTARFFSTLRKCSISLRGGGKPLVSCSCKIKLVQ